MGLTAWYATSGIQNKEECTSILYEVSYLTAVDLDRGYPGLVVEDIRALRADRQSGSHFLQVWPQGVVSKYTYAPQVHPVNIAKPCIYNLSEHSGRETPELRRSGGARETRTLLRGLPPLKYRHPAAPVPVISDSRQTVAPGQQSQ